MKTNLVKIINFNLLYFIVLYIFLFVIYPSNSSYFECSILLEKQIFTSNFSYYLPVSCDQEVYMVGVQDFNSIISFDYNYQSRPLYILFVKIFYEIYDLFINESNIKEFLSFVSVHLFIASVSAKYFIDSLINLKIQVDKKYIKFLTLFITISPIFKWGIFDSAHQTLTFLQFILCFYFLSTKYDRYLVIFMSSFFLGVLMLANMTFAIPFFFLIFHKSNNVKKFLNNFGNNFISLFLLIIPVILWRSYILQQGYNPYNSATQYWKQFIWIKDFILVGYENINYNLSASEYYCMSIPLFLECYIKDFVNSILYLFLPIILCLFMVKHIKKENNEVYKFSLFNLLFIFILSFLFWSLIGWYPPLRFNLYSIGSFVTLLFCLQFLTIKNSTAKNLYAFAYTSYFLFLNHWNYLGVIRFNFGIAISVITAFVLILLYFVSKKNKTKIF